MQNSQALSKNSASSQMSENAGENNVLPGIFRFLARSLSYPDADWLNNDYFAALRSMLAELGWHGDIGELDDLIREDPDILETLQIEHTRLFINAVPHVVAPPYGSIYMTGEGTMMSKSTEQVRDFYRQRGFDLAPGKEIADHLVYELEFLALLAESGDLADEELFLQRFFRPWFGKFQDQVIEGADHPFYRIMVRLIDFFTKEEL